MKALILILLSLVVLVLLIGIPKLRALSSVQAAEGSKSTRSFYDLKTSSLEGEPVDLADYKGKVALVVNVASKCGLTPQYEGLEALYRELSPRGFVILGFPSNDFMGQEPGTAEEIREFCTLNYEVTFPLFEKVQVKGEHKCEIYRLLTTELPEPDWNFTKYLVDTDGKVVYRFGPRTKPADAEMRAKIEELLGTQTREG
ncbi:MAG: glutathione peroxidase [bacterium]